MRIFTLQFTRIHAAILAVLVLLSVAAAGAVALVLPATYETSGAVVLIGPNIGSDGKITNPFLDFTPSSNSTADLLRISSLTPSTVKAVKAQGGTDSYEVAGSLNGSEPLLTITAQAPTPAQAITTAKIVMKSITDDFASLQVTQKVATTQLGTIVTLSEPEKTSRVWKKAIEYGAAVFAGGAVMSFLLVVLLDRRRRRKEAAVGIGGTDDDLRDGVGEQELRSESLVATTEAVPAHDVARAPVAPPTVMPAPVPFAPPVAEPVTEPVAEPEPTYASAHRDGQAPQRSGPHGDGPNVADTRDDAPARTGLHTADVSIVPAPAAGREPYTPRRAAPRSRPAPRVRPHPVQTDERDMSFTRLSNAPAPRNGTNGHGTNGHSTNGHSTNGHGTNGHSTNGHGTNGHGTNGRSLNGHAWPKHDMGAWTQDPE